MATEGSQLLPPEALTEWAEELERLLGLEEPLEIGQILELARDAAHNVARPAAPLTTFALGLAVGLAADPASELPRLVELLQTRCREWESE